ncbi:hypothetical protein HC761_01705 [bacterium]|nr:hypothetical protein [bacterium]
MPTPARCWLSLKRGMASAKARFALLALCALCAAGAANAQVYKCRKGGVVAYQDKPCPRGTQLGRITLESAPVPGKTPTSSIRLPQPVASTPPASPAPPPLPSAANYLCTRYDGSTYHTASNMPKRYFVSGAQLKVPRPGIAPSTKLWVSDECKEAPLKDACMAYELQILANDKQQQGASAAEIKALTRDSQRIRTISNSRCRNDRFLMDVPMRGLRQDVAAHAMKH